MIDTEGAALSPPRTWDYHLTVKTRGPVGRGQQELGFVGLNIMGLPEPIDTFNGVALALGRVGQMLGVRPDNVAIIYHIEIKPGPKFP